MFGLEKRKEGAGVRSLVSRLSFSYVAHSELRLRFSTFSSQLGSANSAAPWGNVGWVAVETF